MSSSEPHQGDEHSRKAQRGDETLAAANPDSLGEHNPIPPPFNPLTSTTTTTAETIVGESVVPGLMQVYESMMGATAATAPAPPPVGDTAAAAAAVHPVFYAMAADGGTAWNTAAVSTIPIPQLHNEYAMGPGSIVTANPLPGTAHQQAQFAPPRPDEATSSARPGTTTVTATGRILRKRTLRESTADGGGLGVMAAAAGAVSSGRSNKMRRKSSSGNSSGSDRGNDTTNKGGNVSNAVGGGNSGKVADGGSNDGRWSKRFSWPEELHRDFVAAIFDVGLKHSSPSTLLEQMPKHEQITTERIKSHLQKYRLHRVKSKKEFMATYDASLKRFQAAAANDNTNEGDTVASAASGRTLSGGQVPAHLAFKSIESGNSEASKDSDGQVSQGARPAPVPAIVENDLQQQRKSNADSKIPGAVTSTGESVASSSSRQDQAQDRPESLMLPRLTDVEKKSPIGAAMGYLMGLFFSLKQQLMAQRVAEVAAVEAAAVAAAAKQQQQQSSSNAPVEAVYHSFVLGQPSSIPPAAAASSAGGGDASGVVMDPLNSTNSTATAATTASNPSTRTNLEENTIMKREMESQMVFQNKMRALKQQELDKYCTGGNNSSTLAGTTEGTSVAPLAAVAEAAMAQAQQQVAHLGSPTTQAASHTTEHMPPPLQGGEETAAPAAPEGRSRGLSLGGSDDFWNTDVVDDQLFEFLMSDG